MLAMEYSQFVQHSLQCKLKEAPNWRRLSSFSLRPFHTNQNGLEKGVRLSSIFNDVCYQTIDIEKAGKQQHLVAFRRQLIVLHCSKEK